MLDVIPTCRQHSFQRISQLDIRGILIETPEVPEVEQKSMKRFVMTLAVAGHSMTSAVARCAWHEP
jgi:hypothetical protein